MSSRWFGTRSAVDSTQGAREPGQDPSLGDRGRAGPRRTPRAGRGDHQSRPPVEGVEVAHLAGATNPGGCVTSHPPRPAPAGVPASTPASRAPPGPATHGGRGGWRRPRADHHRHVGREAPTVVEPGVEAGQGEAAGDRGVGRQRPLELDPVVGGPEGVALERDGVHLLAGEPALLDGATRTRLLA